MYKYSYLSIFCVFIQKNILISVEATRKFFFSFSCHLTWRNSSSSMVVNNDELFLNIQVTGFMLDTLLFLQNNLWNSMLSQNFWPFSMKDELIPFIYWRLPALAELLSRTRRDQPDRVALWLWLRGGWLERWLQPAARTLTPQLSLWTDILFCERTKKFCMTFRDIMINDLDSSWAGMWNKHEKPPA